MAKRCRVYRPKAQDGYNFRGVQDPTEYLGDLIESGQNIDKEAYFNAWNASAQGANTQYSTNLSPNPSTALYSPLGYQAPPARPAVDTMQNIRSGSNEPQYGRGPRLKKRMTLQSGGEPTMTQDSQKDPVHAEKTNNFMNWLHSANQAAQVEQMMQEDMQAIDQGFAYGGYTYQDGGETSGYKSGDYGFKKDINLGYFDAALSNMPGPMDSIMAIGHGLNAMGAFNKRDKKGRGATQPMNGETYSNTPQNTSTTPGFKTPDAMPDSGFGSKQPDTFGRNTDQSFGQGQPMTTLGDQFNQPAFNPSLYMQYGGVSYPGAMPLWDPNDTDTSPEAFDAYMDEENAIPERQSTINEADYTTAPMREFEPGGPDDPMRKDKKKRKNPFAANPNKSNAQHTNEAMGAITTMKGVTGLASFADRMKREQDIKNRMSNVFEFTDVQGSDRGDYMVNAPGIGSNFRPDEHTRMGYNTKIAQQGGEYNMDDELELSEAEINDLIAQGYNLEYLD